MNNVEIEKIISSIDNSVNVDTAFIELFDSHQVQDLDLNLQGNKDGLLLLANQLLKASLTINENKSDSPIPLCLDKQKWFNQKKEIINNFKFIEFEAVKEFYELNDYKNSIKDSIIKYGCLTTIVLILVSIIVGVQTIFHWFYK